MPRANAPERPQLRRRYDQRRDDLVAAAARLFAERGYRNTSIDDLVEATGLQRGGLYHYIDGKQQLLLLIHEELMSGLLDQAEEILAVDATPERHFRELMRVWVEHVAAFRDHMVVFAEERRLIEADPSWATVRGLRERFSDLLAQVLERGQESGAFEIVDRDLALLSILGVVNHMAVWLDPGGRLPAAAVADRCSELLLNGLGRRS